MNLNADNEIEKRVFEYVLANASPDLMARIDAEGKTIQGCWKFVTSYARKHAANNQYCMTDEEAFGLVMHYYSVNWCNEPFGRKHQAVWSDVDSWIGKWGYCERDNDGTIDLGGDWLNWFDW